MATPTDPAHRVTGPALDRARHSVRPHGGALRLTMALTGMLAAVAAIGFGTAALLRSPGGTDSATLTTARHITVTAPVVPLSARQITDLLVAPPDYGGLRDPARRASCLAGLGYPAATRVLGARPVQIGGQSGVLLVVAGDTAETLRAVAVAATCSAADTGLLAETTVTRP